MGDALDSAGTDVFLSYKVEDRARLLPLVGALEAEGFGVWWDAHIAGGSNWQDDLEKHLESARCVVVAWSKRSVAQAGHFVRDEARRAQRRGVYLPILLDAVDLPLGFGEVQAVSLKGWKGNRSDPRFGAVALAVRNVIAGTDKPQVGAADPGARISRRALVAGAAGVAAISAASLLWFELKSTAGPDGKRVAVLPFENLSADPSQAYFSEGLAEELRGALSRVGLQVIGRTSSEAVAKMDSRSAARRLGVGNILTGSVRRSPDMLRIRTELVSGSDGVERWAANYDRGLGDTITIQTDIAANVAEALSIQIGDAGRAELTLGGTRDSAAQDLYLRAADLKYTMGDQASLRQSISLLDQAITRDANYADALALKATELEILGSNYGQSTADSADKIAQAEVAARRAITLAPKLGAAYVPLALIQADAFEFQASLQSIRQALTLSPGNWTVVSNASTFLQWFGSAQKAFDLADRLVELDPLRANSYLRRGAVQLFALRQYPQAINSFRRALSLAPKLASAHNFTADCLLLMGRTAEAKAEFTKVAADDPARMTGEAIIALRNHDGAEAERILHRMHQLFGAAASFQYAQIYAQAGSADRAFAELENAIRVKDPGMTEMKSEPFLDPIARDVRFSALLKRLNFPSWS